MSGIFPKKDENFDLTQNTNARSALNSADAFNWFLRNLSDNPLLFKTPNSTPQNHSPFGSPVLDRRSHHTK